MMTTWHRMRRRWRLALVAGDSVTSAAVARFALQACRSDVELSAYIGCALKDDVELVADIALEANHLTRGELLQEHGLRMIDIAPAAMQQHADRSS
eukprot:scaffold3159_cov393-Prasinococcus_capsulatus_cf.AAC.26